jgi:3-deoxy-D-manno-octulosonate 8-phosphate phosphatase (KDO 8-P phosphatase)
MTLKTFILDVDGVMTTGQFLYSENGKAFKIFGPHDADGLKLIKDKIKIKFITADKRGAAITHRRIVEDMGYPLEIVTEAERFDYVHHHDFESTVFMGDGFYDAPIMEKCALSIAPASARVECLRIATYVTPSKAAEGAVMDACLYLRKILNEQA